MSFFLKTLQIKRAWTDYNRHMNLAFYIHIFDIAAEVMLKKFEMGEDSAKKNKKSTFVVESHTNYNQEVKAGEKVNINLIYLDFDKKRIHYKLSMVQSKEKYLAATTEVLSLYIDLNLRKVTEFEKDKTKIMESFINRNLSIFNPGKLFLADKLKKKN